MTGTGNNVNAYNPKKIAAAQAANNSKPAGTETVMKQPEVEEKKYQQYTSARVAVNIITDLGVKIKFSGHEYITDREAEIDYLDGQIELGGLPGITKGIMLKSKTRDPMEELRAKHRQELLEEQALELQAAALGKTQDMGKTEDGGSKISPMSSKGVANHQS